MLIIIFLELGKSEAMNLMQNIDLAEKVKHHKNIFKKNIKIILEAVNLLKILI